MKGAPFRDSLSAESAAGCCGRFSLQAKWRRVTDCADYSERDTVLSPKRTALHAQSSYFSNSMFRSSGRVDLLRHDDAEPPDGPIGVQHLSSGTIPAEFRAGSGVRGRFGLGIPVIAGPSCFVHTVSIRKSDVSVTEPGVTEPSITDGSA